MGSGAGSVIIGANDRNTNRGAQVVNGRLLVSGSGGGGGGDVNIAEVGGNPVGATVPVSGTVSVNQPVTVQGTVDVNQPVTVQGAVDISNQPIAVVGLVDIDNQPIGVDVTNTTPIPVTLVNTAQPLSGGTGDGRPISVNAIASPSTIHTASGPCQVYLVVSNRGNANYVQVTLLWGGTGVADQMRFDIPRGETRVISDGIFLGNGLTILAFANAGNNASIAGYVVPVP